MLQFFTGSNESLLEQLQAKVPAANFVKAFSCVGSPFMVDPDFGGQKPTLFTCGNNEKAKSEVKGVLTEFGWEIEDMGAAEAARAIELFARSGVSPGSVVAVGPTLSSC